MAKFELKLRKRNNSKEDLIRDLQRVATAFGMKTITKAQYDEKGSFGATTILRRFGSWNEALEASSLGVGLRLNVPIEELFENLANIWERLGRQPVGKDVEKSDGGSRFSLGLYEKRFGAWNKALEAFGAYINSDEVCDDDEIPKVEKGKNKAARQTKRRINWRLRAMVLVRDNCICKMCGASPAKNPEVVLHVDHMLPWSKGGETILENLQTLCHVCNVGKSDEVL